MKIKILLICILPNIVHCLFAEDNLYKYNISKQRTTYQEFIDRGDNVIWDFSKSDTIGDNFNISLFMPDSSNLTLWSLIEHNTRYNYKLQNDTLYLLNYENPLSFIKYSKPEIVLHFPIEKIQSLTNEFIGTGEYGHLYQLSINGSRNVSIVANGILKLPNTIFHNTLLLHSCRKYIQNGLDSIPIHSDLYQWFSPACNIPVYEIIKTTINGQIDFQASFIYNLDNEQENKIKEYENQLQRNNIITYLNCYPNPVENTLFVNYTLEEQSEIIFSIHNSLGLSIYQSTPVFQEKGNHTQTINLSGEIIGAYTLYIKTGNQIIKEVIIKK